MATGTTPQLPNPTLNPQVADTLSTSNAVVLGQAPSTAMGSLYQTIGNSVAMAAANAVYAQQQANVTYQTASTIAVAHLVQQKDQS